MSFLILDRVSKSFGKAEVIQDASLIVEKGETVAIVGPSGAGKTVLLRLIAGVYPVDGGDIRLGGRSVRDVPAAERGVGLAFQNFALYPHMSARENVASALRARKLPEAEVRRRVGEVTALLRIDHVLDRKPGQLSNGQKQRTALARALVSGATLQMLDDPLRNVDAKLRYEMRFELPRLLMTFNATVLYVTQDYREAMAASGSPCSMAAASSKSPGRTRCTASPRRWRSPSCSATRPSTPTPSRPLRTAPWISSGAGSHSGTGSRRWPDDPARSACAPSTSRSTPSRGSTASRWSSTLSLP